MEEEEKLALSTSLPELIQQIAVTTRFKAALLSSELWEEYDLDNLLEKNNGQNLIFKLVQRLKKENEEGAFLQFLKLLKESGQTRAVELLQYELVRHTQLSGTTSKQRLVPNSRAFVTSGIRVSVDYGLSVTASQPDTVPTCLLGPDELEELKRELRRLLPKRGRKGMLGDVVVTARYYGQVYDFVNHVSERLGSIPVIDTARPYYKRADFCYLPPECCALLSRFGLGKSQLFHYKDRGHDVIRHIDGSIVYCRAYIRADPGSILIVGGCSLSTTRSLRETLSHVTVWRDFIDRQRESGEEIDLSRTAADWYPTSATMGLNIEWKPRLQGEPSLFDLKRNLHDCLARGKGRDGEGRVLVTRSYARQVSQFTKLQSTRLIGPFEGPSLTPAAHNIESLAAIPGECGAMLTRVFGGSATLVYGVEHGCKTLDDMDCTTQYIGVRLLVCSGEPERYHGYRQTSSDREHYLGSYFLSVTRMLSETLASAVGWFPSRARTMGSSEDLDLSLTVRQWFDASKRISIIMWN